MYKIIRAIGHDRSNKLDIITSIHSPYGNFGIKPEIGKHIYFIFTDGTKKILSSSIIHNIEIIKDQVKINTNDVEYVFQKVEG